MKKIIVPVDFSATAANAAEYAGYFAAFYGADVLLYHTYELPVAIGDISYPVFDVNEMQEAAAHDMAVFKENLAAKMKVPLTIHTHVEMGIMYTGLTTYCDAEKPDLVVMGLSGKNALTRLVVGSNTIKTVYNLKYPVLVVPPKAFFAPIRLIGFACDYREIARSTPLALIKKFVQDFNAELHILNVDYNNKNFSADALKESFVLSEILGNIKPEYHSVESEDVTVGINWFAEKAKLDLIIAVPKKHKLVQRMFSRSHTQDLIFHTHLPVLCLHQ
ncbi:MAG TPA: universal stress protein [Ferruginibacter sp.]|nr:universal stress protein [Ferruginibacter sp.]HMP19838.1 universal stress protein [Ferruginibacter sp.]